MIDNNAKTDIEANREVGILSESDAKTLTENRYTAKGYALEINNPKIINLVLNKDSWEV